MNLLEVWGGASILFIILTSIIAAFVNAERFRKWADEHPNDSETALDKAFEATGIWFLFTLLLSATIGLLMLGFWILQMGFTAPR